MKTHIFSALYAGTASRILLCLTIFFFLSADGLLFAKVSATKEFATKRSAVKTQQTKLYAKLYEEEKTLQMVSPKEKKSIKKKLSKKKAKEKTKEKANNNRLNEKLNEKLNKKKLAGKNKTETVGEGLKNKKMTREEWKILKAQKEAEEKRRQEELEKAAQEKAKKLEQEQKIIDSFFAEKFQPACKNLFFYRAVQNSFSDICNFAEKKYFFVLQNRFHHSVNRDLKDLDEYSRYTIEATDDRMTHVSSSLLFAGFLQQPPQSFKISESESKLVFSAEIFLPWSYWYTKSAYEQNGFSLLLHSLYYLWQKEESSQKQFYVKLGRFFSADKMRKKQEHFVVYDTPVHGLEFFVKQNHSKLYFIPFNIDSPLTEILGQGEEYYFSSSENKDKKQDQYFRGDLIAYNASFLYQGFFAVAENKAIDFWAKLSYTRRGAFSQGSQKSDHGRLSNIADHDYLLDGDIYFAVNVKPTHKKNIFNFFISTSASYGVDHTYNFKIPLNGLSFSSGFRWKYFFKDHEINGNTTIAWISPPAFFDSGWLKSAGYTSSQKKSYGGILLNQTCGYSPHAHFNFEQTSYMKKTHCFQLPADFYWYQSLGWNFTTQRLQTALANTSTLSPDTQKKINEKIPQVSWSVVLKVWLFASLTRYSKTLPQNFSVMGSELNLTLRREVQHKNTIYVSGGIFIPSTIAKTQSNHFASMLWRGGNDIFYGVQAGADFMF